MSMRRRLTWLVAILLWVTRAPATRGQDSSGFVAQEIDGQVGKVCYAVTTADVNGDGRLDVVAVTEDAVVWYENPSWDKHEITRGTTARDNVCIAAHDIDGDGRVDFALGAGWRPPDTTTAGTLQWLGRDASGVWKIHPIVTNEPSIHRIRWGDVLGTGRPQLVVVPLQGRGTKGPDWGKGDGVKVLVYSVPEDPRAAAWPVEAADESLHTIHNFQLLDTDADGRDEILLAAWEGVYLLDRGASGSWSKAKWGSGNQSASPNKGASEIKFGRLKNGREYIATIEPWHGFDVVVYTQPGPGESLWKRSVIDTGVSWGHAVWCADVDGDGSEECIIGQRDPRKDEGAGKGPGVWIYDLDDWVPGQPLAAGRKLVVDDGGMACEDACAADLDGDGRPEIIAGGRATHNVKIYWNRRGARKAP
jgi:hypothetical protein